MSIREKQGEEKRKKRTSKRKKCRESEVSVDQCYLTLHCCDFAYLFANRKKIATERLCYEIKRNRKRVRRKEYKRDMLSKTFNIPLNTLPCLQII